jgi:hypothetical protein
VTLNIYCDRKRRGGLAELSAEDVTARAHERCDKVRWRCPACRAALRREPAGPCLACALKLEEKTPVSGTSRAIMPG